MKRRARRQTVRGFRTPSGPTGWSGVSGRITSAAAAKTRASWSSCSVSTRRTKRWRRERAARRITTPTARPEARLGSRTARAPSRTVVTSATSRREAGISRSRTAVADGRQRPDDEGRGHEDRLPAEGQADAARERGERERSDSGRRAAAAGALASLPLDADEQPDAERDREADGEGLGQERPFTASRDDTGRMHASMRRGPVSRRRRSHSLRHAASEKAASPDSTRRLRPRSRGIRMHEGLVSADARPRGRRDGISTGLARWRRRRGRLRAAEPRSPRPGGGSPDKDALGPASREASGATLQG